MLEKDDTGAALLMLGKLILFIGMFVLLYAGNKRGRGWYTLSEPLYKKPYLCRWKWLMLAAFIFTALENNWMNMNDDGEIDSISYVSLMVLAEIPAYTLMLATLVKRAEVLKFRQWIFTIFIIFMPIGLIYCPWIYWLVCISLYWWKEDNSPEEVSSVAGVVETGGNS